MCRHGLASMALVKRSVAFVVKWSTWLLENRNSRPAETAAESVLDPWSRAASEAVHQKWV